MNVQQQKQEKGFTIIEVILVLAIAGLIFLMVFLALPALQRGQRDNARKNDVSIVASAVTDFSTNNNGSKVPAGTYSDASSTFGKYIYAGSKTISDNSTSVVVRNGSNGAGGTTDAQIEVWPGGKCANNGGQVTKGTARSYAITTKLEAGGGQGYCLNS